jgi:glyceraldehyde 3-phosphate dehydrogenase
MAIRVGINGFGRIGRCVARALQSHKDIELVLINDLTNAVTLAHLLKYDSVHGQAATSVEARENALVVGGKSIQVTAISNPAEIPWGQNKVDVVLECTGRFTKGEEVAAHIRAGARKVILSAPGKAVDKTIVIGVNDNEYNMNEHNVLSNGSCTTNCLAPVALTLNDAFGIKKGLMTTIHSYTNDQRILDLPHSDLRRARAAALSDGITSEIALAAPVLVGIMLKAAARARRRSECGRSKMR